MIDSNLIVPRGPANEAVPDENIDIDLNALEDDDIKIDVNALEDEDVKIDLNALEDDPDIQKVGDVRAAMRIGADTSPTQAADSYYMSKNLGMDFHTVNKSYSDVKANQAANGFNFESIVKTSPNLSSFISVPENAMLSKDDLDNLAKTEKTITEASKWSLVGNSLAFGALNAAEGIARIPELLINNMRASQYTSNIDQQTKPFKVWEPENSIADYFKEKAQEYTIPELEADLSNQISKGDWHNASRTLLANVASSAPQSLALIGAALAGPVTGAVALGTVAMGAGATSLKQDLATPDSKANDYATLMGANYKGALEGASEYVGTFGIFKSLENKIAMKWGKDTALNIMKNMGQSIGYAMVGEGNEELVNSIASDFVDKTTGVNTEATTGMLERGLTAGLVGAASGGALTGPSSIMAGVARAQRMNQVKQTGELFNSLKSDAEASKLRERTPEKYREFVSSVMKDGTVDNVFISVDDFKTYMQSKNIDPLAASHELGIQDNFRKAEEHGGNIVIPTSEFVDKIVPSEHYEALSKDAKFHENDLTANEAQRETEQIKTLMEEEKVKANLPEASIEATEPVIEDTRIKDDLKKKLLASGVDKGTADIYAEQMASVFNKGLVARAGLDPFSEYQKQNIIVNDQTVETLKNNEAIDYSLPSEEEIKSYDQSTGDNSGNVIDARSRFALTAPIEQVKKDQAISSNEVLENLRQRYNDKEGSLAQIERAQDSSLQPYHSKFDNGVTIPNMLSAPSGIIGEESISHGASAKDVILDQLSWLDSKYRATFNLIKKHKDQGLPLTINTSSDLIGRNDYIEAMPKDTEINFWMPTKNDRINRVLFPANPSRLRLEKAIEKLQSEGFKVNIIEPTVESITKAVGSTDQIAKVTGFDKEAVNGMISDAINGTDILSFNQSKVPTFFNKSEKIITQKMGNRASPDQVRGMLKELTQDEMKFLGIDEFLTDKKTVEKTDLLNVIKQNSVILETIKRREIDNSNIISEAIKKNKNKVYIVKYDDPELGSHEFMFLDEGAAVEEAQALEFENPFLDISINSTKYNKDLGTDFVDLVFAKTRLF